MVEFFFYNGVGFLFLRKIVVCYVDFYYVVYGNCERDSLFLFCEWEDIVREISYLVRFSCYIRNKWNNWDLNLGSFRFWFLRF